MDADIIGIFCVLQMPYSMLNSGTVFSLDKVASATLPFCSPCLKGILSYLSSFLGVAHYHSSGNFWLV